MFLSQSKVRSFFKENSFLLLGDEAYQMATLRHAPEMSFIIWEIKEAFQQGINPVKCTVGTSESYILYDTTQQPIGFFKLQNAVKEYAAYRLDHKNFAQVPSTVISALEHPIWGGKKIGALQEFINDARSAVHLNRKDYQKIKPTSIRRMAILDMRLINEDRHTSNMLVLDDFSLVPIDHELILSSSFCNSNFVWVNWDQAMTFFSTEEKNYIKELDVEKDRAILHEELRLPEQASNRFFVASRLLQIGAHCGFQPFQLGKIFLFQRGENTTSLFCKLINRLKDRNPHNWNYFKKVVNDEIEKILTYI